MDLDEAKLNAAFKYLAITINCDLNNDIETQLLARSIMYADIDKWFLEPKEPNEFILNKIFETRAIYHFRRTYLRLRKGTKPSELYKIRDAEEREVSMLTKRLIPEPLKLPKK